MTPGAEPDGVRQGAVWNSATTPVIDLTRSPRICEFLRVHARHLILLATMIAASVPACTVETDSRRNHPNIVLIMADDLGYEALGAYGGSSYSTPVLDRLARQGIRFDHAYSQPLCTNTRVQLMTGRYQHRYWQAFGILPNRERTIGHLMQAAGYRTLIAGKWQLHSYDPVDYPGAEERRGTGMRGAESGFDEYLLWHAWHTEDKGSRYADPTFDLNGELIKEKMGAYGPDVFVDYINDFVERNCGVPFFVYYPIVLTHDPFVPTPDSPRWHDESRRHLQDPAYFADMVAYMDKLVGKIVANLDRLDLRQETLVLFYADNGTHRSISSRLGSRMIQGWKGKDDRCRYPSADDHQLARNRAGRRGVTGSHRFGRYLPDARRAGGHPAPRPTPDRRRQFCGSPIGPGRRSPQLDLRKLRAETGMGQGQVLGAHLRPRP